MSSIATAIISYPDVAWWFSVGVWGLLIMSAGGIVLAALGARQALPRSSIEQQSHAPAYQRAA